MHTVGMSSDVGMAAEKPLDHESLLGEEEKEEGEGRGEEEEGEGRGEEGVKEDH